MVDVSGKGHHHRSGHTLLEQAAQLALGIDLSAESGHPEVVLGAEGCDALLRQATHHGAAGGNGKGHVNTRLDLVRQALPVRGVEGALGLQLGARNEAIRLVPGNVGEGGVGALRKASALPDRLQANGELGSDGLQVLPDEDAGQAALEIRGVEGLQGGGKVIAEVLVLELGHVLAGGAGSNLESRLGGEGIAPPPVERG